MNNIDKNQSTLLRRLKFLIRKISARMRLNPYYYLILGIGLCISSIMDIVEDYEQMTKHHFFVIFSVIMIIDSFFKLKDGYKEFREGVNELKKINN